MKKKSRFLAIILALTLCFASTTTAFAAETEQSLETEQQSVARSVVIAGGSTSFSNSGDIYLTLDGHYWGCGLMFSVMGNPDGQYHCNVVNLDSGYEYSVGTVYGNGQGTTLSYHYLGPGTYKFHIFSWNGDTTRVSAVAQIFD